MANHAEAPRDYYEVLGVARDADAKTIKNAFRELALKYHPDRCKEEGAEDRFKEIAQAYAVLSDPHKRAQYDARGFAGVEGFSSEDLFGGIDFGDLFRGGGLGLGDDLISRLFGGLGGHRRPAGPPRGADIEAILTVPLEMIANGGKQPLTLEHPRACTACSGSGAAAGTTPRQCAVCDGTGKQVTRSARGNVALQQITTCPECRGRGAFVDTPCTDCTGTGFVRDRETLTITVPPGIGESTAMRVPGRGRPSPVPSGRPGDLYVHVRSARDDRFVRRGVDLWRDEPLAVVDAVLGTVLEVPTLSGSARVSVPAGTQPDAVLRLRGQGLPRFGSPGERGDLNVRVDVRVPQELSGRERELYEQLRALQLVPRR